jgi:nicotinamidase-related amidase
MSPTPETRDTALLVMDVQPEIVSRVGEEVLEPIQRAIATARREGFPVIFVKVGFRPGYPEVSPRNQAFSGLASGGAFVGAASRVHPDLTVEPEDLEVAKKRISAFAGNDLEMILRSRGISTLVLTGIATSGVVLSTVRAAADLDYRLLVLRDCCADGDTEVHRVLLDKVFPRQAEVIDARRWAEDLGG